MTTQMLDPRVTAWLDTGPQAPPPVAFDEIMAAVATTAQEPRRDRLGGRVLPFTRPRLLLAAAVVVVAVGTGGYLLRDTIADVATPPRDPSSLLLPFPSTRTTLERSGGPAAADETVVLTNLPKGKAYVVAATCTGGGSMTVDLWDRSVVYEGDVADADQRPNDRLPVTCDGTPTSMRIATVDAPTDDNEVTVGVEAGTTWQVAVGEVTDLDDKPVFPALETGDGAVVLIDTTEAMLAHNLPGPGIGIQLPPAVTTVTALVQCLGDPVVVTPEGGEPAATLDCSDPATTHRVDLPGVDGGTIHAGTAGLAWVRLAAEAVPGAAATRPDAPELPAGLAEVTFAEGDGSNVAFGRLGGNDQTVVVMEHGPAAPGAGDTVVVARPDGEGTVLERWRMTDATLIGTLATIPVGEVFGSWVDATHQQVFYAVRRLVAGVEQASWHRVGFDGSGDVELAAVPVEGITSAQQALAVDDSAFVIQWCVGEACHRVIYDAASGAIRRVSPGGGTPCDLVGVIDGSVVLGTGDCESTSDRGSVVAEDLGGGPSRTLREGRTSGVLVRTSAGPAVVLFDAVGDTRTTISIVGLDGSAPRDLGTVEHESGMGPRPSSVRLPAGDWVLLAGPIGDTPGMRPVGRPVPVLLNVMTGERIELPNLPHSP